MTLKLYYDLLSQPARALYIFLKVNKINFEPKYINLTKGEHKKGDFLKINPLGLIPAIQDNDFVVKESVGIFRYLCREKNVPDHWYPKDSKHQAVVDEYLEWQHLGLRLGCGLYFRINFVEPRITQKPPLDSDIKRTRMMMTMACDNFENIWLKDSSKFLFGDKPGVADLLAACELEQPRIVGYDPRNGRPKITAYLERVKTETNPYYDEAHQVLEKLVALASKM